jgi:hypothetical protein
LSTGRTAPFARAPKISAKFFQKGIDKIDLMCYNVYCEVREMTQCSKCFHQYCVSNDSLASCNVCEDGDMFSPIEESEEEENG